MKATPRYERYRFHKETADPTSLKPNQPRLDKNGNPLKPKDVSRLDKETPSTRVKISDRAKELAESFSKIPRLPTPSPSFFALSDDDSAESEAEVAIAAKEAAIQRERKQREAEEQKQTIKLQANQELSNKVTKTRGTLKKPAVFMINGFVPFGINLAYGGIEEMADSIPEARKFAHDQIEEMLKEISKRDPKQPLILVGHSFGGDTAVEIAKKLNSLDYGFRKVDLLVTLDSVGMDNDIIPQNVVKNLNYIGDQTSIFNDGPNIAKDATKTAVINNLRSEGHTELDDSESIQMEILQHINDILLPSP